jgi:CheY-like chemotaxis protein
MPTTNTNAGTWIGSCEDSIHRFRSLVPQPHERGALSEWAGANVIRAAPPCERVLIVEDDVDTACTLAEVLQLEGVGVTHAVHSIAEAEQALAGGFRPSVIILDLSLNGERGETLLRRIRAVPDYEDIRVIAFSGDCDGLLRLREAVDAALLKPTEPARIVEALYAVSAVPASGGVLRRGSLQATTAISGGSR